VSDAPTLLYLEADDEITAVVRRVRAAPPGRVVVVAPGRSRATSSAVALRLLAREDREIVIVGDALTRSLAAEAALASFASLDDARRATPGEVPPSLEPRQAKISVVRGAADDTPPALALVRPESADLVTRSASADAETRPVPVVREPPAAVEPITPRRTSRTSPRRRPAARPARPARRRSVVGLVLLVAAFGATAVAGAVLLPSAVIVIEPASVEVGPRTYQITSGETERRSGSATATATVTATGTYTTQVAASGTVVLYNWTFFPVAVPAGTFVAAGEQAFATQADVVVPRGRLTGAGTILAGDIEVGVVAAAIGPAANVPAGAIDRVVNESVDLRLGGVPENPERRVDNPAPTTGGEDSTGPEMLQADVDAAVAALRTELGSLVADELPADPALLVVQAAAAEPVIDGREGLVGTRDQPTSELSGSLAWEAFVADRSAAIADAEAALVADEAAIPDGHELVPESTTVTLEDPSLDGESVVVTASVAARAAADIDIGAVRERVAGLTVDEARAALADLGTPTVSLWPGWVRTVTDLDWRVEVRVEDGAEEIAPSGSLGP
jgi:hypothetical protein